MAATHYLLLLLLALAAGPAVVGALGRYQKAHEAAAPAPRRPRPPPPAPRRPRPHPPPSPSPPAGPLESTAATSDVPLAGTRVSNVEQESVLAVDPDTQELGIPATEERNLAASSGTPAVSDGVTDSNPEGELQYQRTGNPHITDDATIKYMELKVKPQPTTEDQGRNCAPSFIGSDAEDNALNYDDIVGLVVKISVKKTSKESKPKFSTKIEDPTESKTAEIQDRQYAHAESHDQEVPEIDSSGGAIEDSNTDEVSHLLNNGPRIYMDANLKLYRSMEDLEVIGVVLENGNLIEKSQNTQSFGTTPSATTVQSSHSAIPSSPRDDKYTRTIRRITPVESFTVQGAENVHLESVTARRNCSSMGAKRHYSRNLNSCASEYPGDSVHQGGALQCAALLSKDTELKLPSRMIEQQRQTLHIMQSARPAEQVISSRLPLRTPGGSTSTPPPLNDAGGNNHAQSEATPTTAVTKKPRKLKKKKIDKETQTDVQPEKWRETRNFATTSSTGGTKSPHSVNPSPHAAGNATGTIRSRVVVDGAANRGADSIPVKKCSARCECDATNPVENTLKFGSFTFEDPIYSIIHSRSAQNAVTMPKTDNQKQKKPASQTRRAANPATSPVCRVCGNRNTQSGTASANIKQRKPDLRAGHLNGQLQQNHVLAPVVVVPIPESMLILSSPNVVSSCPSALNSGVGYHVNQQTAEGGSSLQNPAACNPTAARPPGHQVASAYNGTRGNSRNQRDAAVQVNFGPLPTRRRYRPHEPYIPRFAALRERRLRAQQAPQAGNAGDAYCWPDWIDAPLHF